MIVVKESQRHLPMVCLIHVGPKGMRRPPGEPLLFIDASGAKTPNFTIMSFAEAEAVPSDGCSTPSCRVAKDVLDVLRFDLPPGEVVRRTEKARIIRDDHGSFVSTNCVMCGERFWGNHRWVRVGEPVCSESCKGRLKRYRSKLECTSVGSKKPKSMLMVNKHGESPYYFSDGRMVPKDFVPPTGKVTNEAPL